MSGSIPTAAVHVAVGVIQSPDGRVLVARRHPSQHQGGLLEFPGGKVEGDESVQEALRRELKEELGIDVRRAFPFKKITFSYSDKTVFLDVWRVLEYEGEPRGQEAQPLAWMGMEELDESQFPAANRGIIAALRLPQLLAITPDDATAESLERRLGRCAQSGIRSVQLRQTQLDDADYLELAHRLALSARALNIRLLYNRSPGFVAANPELFARGEAGLHLSSAALSGLRVRPCSSSILLGASCHSLDELRQAVDVGADYALLSPVLETKGVGEHALGWEGFAALASRVSLPLYALGGVKRSDLSVALRAGAYGAAGIRDFDLASHDE